MFTLPRFVYDFANYRRAAICQNKQMQKDVAEKALSKINNTIHCAEQKDITIEEAMRGIFNCFES